MFLTFSIIQCLTASAVSGLRWTTVQLLMQKETLGRFVALSITLLNCFNSTGWPCCVVFAGLMHLDLSEAASW